MKQEDGVHTMHAFQPVVSEYEVLRVALVNALGTYYLHPSQQEELETKLVGYLAFGVETGYKHPIHSIEIVKMSPEKINRYFNDKGETLEEKMQRITSDVDTVVEAIRSQTYNTVMQWREFSICEVHITDLRKKLEEEMYEKRQDFERHLLSVLSRPRDSYVEIFNEGANILASTPFPKQEYQRMLMRLATSIMHHAWGSITKENWEYVEQDRLNFILHHVLPTIMKRG